MRTRWGAGGRRFHLLTPLILIILFSGYHLFTHEEIKAQVVKVN